MSALVKPEMAPMLAPAPSALHHFPEGDRTDFVGFYRHRRLEQMRQWVGVALGDFKSARLSAQEGFILCETWATAQVGRVLYNAEWEVLREAVRDVTALWQWQAGLEGSR